MLTTGTMDEKVILWTVLLFSVVCWDETVGADVQPNQPNAGTGTGGNNGLELTNDEQEFSFKSRKFSLSIPGGTTFVLPPGVVLPPDMMIKLQAASTNPVPPANTAAGPASGLPPSPNLVQPPSGKSAIPPPKSTPLANQEVPKEVPKIESPVQPARQTQPPIQRANYKESGLSAYQGYGSLVLGPAKKNDFRVLNDWEK